MWSEIQQQIHAFPDAVLTGIDSEGFPFSIRCNPTCNTARQQLDIPAVAGAVFEAGPASLLMHSHDDKFWDQKVFQVIGNVERTPEGWVFTPTRLLTQADSPLAAVKMIMGARKSARQYLAKRGIQRPAIAWEHFKKMY